MPIKHVLVVAKRSAWDTFSARRADPQLTRLESQDSPLIKRLKNAHQTNLLAIQTVCQVLKERGLQFQVVQGPKKQHARSIDLVVSVGGDGTLLDASHAVRDQPVLAVNSLPDSSVGHFCASTAVTFALHLDWILGGQVHPLALTRIEILRNGRALPHLALNDVLFAHDNPAASSRYQIRIGDDREEHVSSGVWISTAAGSTAAMHAAGGVPQPLMSRDLQYRVRERYRKRDSLARLEGGIISEPLHLISLMQTAAVFLDGHRLRYRLGYGDEVMVRTAGHPLWLYHLVTMRTGSP